MLLVACVLSFFLVNGATASERTNPFSRDFPTHNPCLKRKSVNGIWVNVIERNPEPTQCRPAKCLSISGLMPQIKKECKTPEDVHEQMFAGGHFYQTVDPDGTSSIFFKQANGVVYELVWKQRLPEIDLGVPIGITVTDITKTDGENFAKFIICFGIFD